LATEVRKPASMSQVTTDVSNIFDESDISPKAKSPKSSLLPAIGRLQPTAVERKFLADLRLIAKMGSSSYEDHELSEKSNAKTVDSFVRLTKFSLNRDKSIRALRVQDEKRIKREGLLKSVFLGDSIKAKIDEWRHQKV